MSEELKTASAIEDVKKGAQDPGLIKLSTGVVLRAKKANPAILLEVMTMFPRPKVPVYYNKQFNRDIENPDDPDYIDRVETYSRKSSSRTLDALIVLGTELKSTPKGVNKCNEDEWIGICKTLHIDMDLENETWRYMMWVKLVAAPEDDDLKLIQEAVGRLSGISEKDVEAAERFPGSDSKPG